MFKKWNTENTVESSPLSHSLSLFPELAISMNLGFIISRHCLWTWPCVLCQYIKEYTLFSRCIFFHFLKLRWCVSRCNYSLPLVFLCSILCFWESFCVDAYRLFNFFHYCMYHYLSRVHTLLNLLLNLLNLFSCMCILMLFTCLHFTDNTDMNIVAHVSLPV